MFKTQIKNTTYSNTLSIWNNMEKCFKIGGGTLKEHSLIKRNASCIATDNVGSNMRGGELLG